MAQQCSICKHEARTKIDKALVATGAVLRGIARTFRVSEDALSRHVKKGHVTQKIAQAQAAQDIVEADDLLKEFNEIQKNQKTIFREARKRKKYDPETGKEIPHPDNRLALEALRDQSKTVEFKGKVLGAFIKGNKPQGENTWLELMQICSPKK